MAKTTTTRYDVAEHLGLQAVQEPDVVLHDSAQASITPRSHRYQPAA